METARIPDVGPAWQEDERTKTASMNDDQGSTTRESINGSHQSGIAMDGDRKARIVNDEETVGQRSENVDTSGNAKFVGDDTITNKSGDVNTDSNAGKKSTNGETEVKREEPMGGHAEAPPKRKKKKSGWTVVKEEPRKNGFVVKTPEEIQADLLLQHQQAATASALANQQHRSRIYVGSLDFSLNEHDIKDVFGAFGEINNIDMPKEGLRSKGFCFVEYSTPEEADMALQMMQNFTLKGRIIKVGRPTATGQITVLPKQMGGVPNTTTPVQPAMMSPVTVTGENDMSRIYIGNVPYNFTAEDIRKIFIIFGTIMSCALIPSTEKPGTHKGYGFLEFALNSEAKIAIETMNGFEIQGKELKVNYSTQSHSKPMPLCSPAINGVPMSANDGYSSSPYAPVVENRDPNNINSRVVIMTNMITPGKIDGEFSKEVEQEATKHGHVEKTRIQIEHNEVRVFLKYSTAEEAWTAIRSIDGRCFDGRDVHCRKYNEQAFDEGRYDM